MADSSIRSTPARDFHDVSSESPKTPKISKTPKVPKTQEAPEAQETRQAPKVHEKAPKAHETRPQPVSPDEKYPYEPRGLYPNQKHYQFMNDKEIEDDLLETSKVLANAREYLEKVRINAPSLEARLEKLKIGLDEKRAHLEEGLLVANDLEVRKQLIEQLKEVTQMEGLLGEAVLMMVDMLKDLEEREKAQSDLMDQEENFQRRLQALDDEQKRRKDKMWKFTRSMASNGNKSATKHDEQHNSKTDELLKFTRSMTSNVNKSATKPKVDDAPTRDKDRKEPDGIENLKTTLLPDSRSPDTTEITEDMKKLLGAIPKKSLRRARVDKLEKSAASS